MRKYQHLFFDLDNTLYNFTLNSYLALKDTFQKLGIMDQLESFDAYFTIYQKVNEQLWADYRDKKVSKQVLRGKRFADSLAAVGVQPPIDPLAIDEQYLAIMPEKTELLPNTIHVLSELKRRNYKMYIITNGFREVQHDKMMNSGLSAFFEKVFISEDIKTTKPSREIFEHAIKSCNARKTESIMIGDAWDTDIVGAKNFGIDQVYFTPESNSYQYAEYEKPTFHVLSLNELLTILA